MWSINFEGGREGVDCRIQTFDSALPLPQPPESNAKISMRASPLQRRAVARKYLKGSRKCGDRRF